MDGTRTRVIAIACPLLLGTVLCVAAQLDPPVPAGGARTGSLTTAVIDLPHTTPPPAPVREAAVGTGTADRLPVAAYTVAHS